MLVGEFEGLQQGEFLCFSQAPEWGSLDTIRVQAEEFQFSHELLDTTIITLQYPNFMQTQIVAIPGEKTKLSGSANNMREIRISGDDDNEALSDFYIETADLKGDEIIERAEAFIRQNPEMWASIALFDKFFVQSQTPDYRKMEELLKLLTKHGPKRGYLHMLTTQVQPFLTCAVGKKWPAFKAKTIKGESISNSTFANKAVLVTFWSTMESSHYHPLVSQRHLMRRVAPQIAQLNICVDADTLSCQRVLRTDTIGGYNVCDRQAFSSPLVSTFGLHTLPSNILVDAKGTIRARNITPDKLEETLKSIGIK